MKLRLLFLLFAIQFVFQLDCKSYDLFTWSNSIPSATGPKIIRFGPDDSLYIGSNHGLHVYKDTTVKYYSTYPIAGGIVNAIAFDSGFVWLGTDSGLVKKTGGLFEVYNTSNSGIISNGVQDILVSGSQVYLACDSGLSVFDGQVWTSYSKTYLGLNYRLFSVGKNNFGLYVMDINGYIVCRTSSGWRPITTDVRMGLYNMAKFQNLNDDTLLVPTIGGYLVDTVAKVSTISSDPCLFEDQLTNTLFLISNPVTGEKFMTIDEGITMSSKYIIKANNFQPDLTDIRSLQFLGLGNNIGELPYNANFFDFDSSGKLFWVSRSNPRGINSVYLSMDSFPSVTAPDVCPYLDINQVRAKIMGDGGMFWDYSGDALYEVPKGSGTTSIFCQGLWIGGLDQSNQLHIAAQTYRQSGADFWPGPLDTISATIDSVTHSNYDSIWKIDRSTIIDFIWRYATGQVQNGSWIVPDIILNWPANGTGNYSRSLAPYYDFNQDGVYNPYDGDYPDIKGSQMLWSVFNDNFAPHGTYMSDRNLGVEIQSSAYAYNCPLAFNDDSVINYTTFYHYEIINRSDTDYHDVYIGNFTDVDLGYRLDDYVGCDTVNDFGFAYNGDDFDEGSPHLGYGLHPPMINNLILAGPVAEPLDGLDNNHNGIIDEQGENCMMNHFSWLNSTAGNDGVPNRAMDFYYRMKSLWLDGRHLTKGGYGYNFGNFDSTNFMFSAVPYSGLFWSETVLYDTGSVSNTADDRRFVIASGPFNLNAHESKTFDFAYVYTRDPNSPNGLTTSIAKNTQDVLRIKQFYESNTFPCDNVISVNEIENIEFNLFPNPADRFVNLILSGKQISNNRMQITDLLGQVVFQKNVYGERNIRFSTENFTPGIYVVNVFSSDTRMSKKFVVLHSEN